MEASGFLQYGGSVDPSSEDVEEWLGAWRTTFARGKKRYSSWRR